MPDPDITFQCESFESLVQDKEWWALYEESFPPTERAPRAKELEMAKAQNVRILCARENGKTVGLATIHLLESFPCVFLMVLAVNPHERHHHIGTQLFEYGWTLGCEELNKKGLQPRGYVWEVEKPELAANNVELKERETRITFYKHLGAQILPCNYIMPPVDGTHTIPMHLLFRPAPGFSLPNEKDCNDLIRAMYFEKYERVNHIDKDMLLNLLK